MLGFGQRQTHRLGSGPGATIPRAACAAVTPQTQYWVRNDSGTTAIVQFGGTPDDPGTYAFSVPAGTSGTLYIYQGWTWKGRIAVVDQQCREEWEQLFDVVGGPNLFGNDIEGGALAIAKDRTVTWVPGNPVPVGSTAPPGPWRVFDESASAGADRTLPSPRPANGPSSASNVPPWMTELHDNGHTLGTEPRLQLNPL